ncbi:hypothetical protein ACO0QE_001070 [Hanseniaspora vineae]
MSKKDTTFATDSQTPLENVSNKQNTTKSNTQNNKNIDVEKAQTGDSGSAIMSGNEDQDNFDVNKSFSDDRRDSTDVFLKPRQDSMSLYTNFMPRLSSATESSIANFLNMDNNNNNTNKGATPEVHRGYSIVNNNMFTPGPSGGARSSSSRRQSVVQGVSGSALNSHIAQQNTYNGARRTSEQLEPFVPPMKFKTPNFGSSNTTGSANYTTSNSSTLKRSNSSSGTRGSKTRQKSTTPLSSHGAQESGRRGAAANILSNNNNNNNSSTDNLATAGLTADAREDAIPSNNDESLQKQDNKVSKANVSATTNNNNPTNKNNGTAATSKTEGILHSNNASPNLHSALPELPALRSDSISSILGAAAMINQPLQPPSKRNSIFIPTDQLTTNTTHNNENHGTMKPPSTTAPTYYNKQQQHQQQQFQQLLNSNSLGNLYSDANNGNSHITDNIDFDIFSNLNTSRKSSFRFGDDFDLSAFRRRDSSVRGTLDLPALPGSSIGNRLRAGSRTFSQNFNHHPFTATPGTNNNNSSNVAPNSISGNGKKEEQENYKNSRYSNFLKNNENAISDYEDDDLIDLHGLTRAASIGAGSGSHAHSNSNQMHNNNQSLLDSRMIMRRKSNLRDNSMTPIPLTTPPLTGFGHTALPNINNSSAVSDSLLGLDPSSHMDVPPSLDFDADGNIITTEAVPKPKSSSKKSSSKRSSSKKSSTKTSSSKSSSSKSSSTKKESSQKSKKRKSSSNTESAAGSDTKESKPKKRKTSKKTTSSSSSSSSGHKNDHAETTSKSTDEKSTSKKSSRSKKESKSKSSKRSKKPSATSSSSEAPSSSAVSGETDASKPSTKKKRASTSSSSKPPKKAKTRGSGSASKVPESLISHPIIVENPMKTSNGTTDKNDNPVLGATRVDQLMLILQARQKGFTTALETTKDGKINIDNAPEIIPPAIELVGGVDKPKTHDLLLNPMSQSPSITTEALLNSVGGVKPDPDAVLMTPNSGPAASALPNQKSPLHSAAGVSQMEKSRSKMASPPSVKGSPAIGTPLMQTAATIASPPDAKSKTDTAQVLPAVSTPPVGASTGVASTPNGAGSPVSATGSATGSVSGKRKLHVCQYCHKQFTQSTHLEVHVRSHIGLKPYECSYCGKTFTQGGNLRTHIRLHTGEQPFQCNVCGKKFSRKGNLQAHSLTHENFRPFQCILDGCDKSFTQLGNLKSHQNKFHLDTLNALTMKLALNNFDLENEEERKLLEYLSSLYKNSNKGIKGRGKNSASATKSKTGTPSQKPASLPAKGSPETPAPAVPVASTEVKGQDDEAMLDEAAVAALTNPLDV